MGVPRGLNMTILFLSFLVSFVTSDILTLKHHILNQNQNFNNNLVNLKHQILNENHEKNQSLLEYFATGFKADSVINAGDTIYRGKSDGTLATGTVVKVYKALKITWSDDVTEDIPIDTPGLTPQKPWLVASYKSVSEVLDKQSVTTVVYDLKLPANNIKLDTHLMAWFDGSTLPTWKQEIEAIAAGGRGPSGADYTHRDDWNPTAEFNKPNFKGVNDATSYASQIINTLWPNKFSSVEIATKSARYRSGQGTAWFLYSVGFSESAHIDIASVADTTYIDSVKTAGNWGFAGIQDFPVKLSAHLRDYMYFNIWVPFREYNACPLGVLDYHYIKNRDKYPQFADPSKRNRWYAPSTMALGDAIVFDGVFSVIHSALQPIPKPDGKECSIRESVEFRVRAKCIQAPCYDWASVWNKLAA